MNGDICAILSMPLNCIFPLFPKSHFQISKGLPPNYNIFSQIVPVFSGNNSL